MNRRTLLGLAGATLATFALPRALREWHVRRQAAHGTLRPSALHTYEEGVDTMRVPVGNGVVKTAGGPIYSASDAVHERMGWRSPAGSGGQLVYRNPRVAASSGSLYLTPHRVSSSATVVGFKQDEAARSFLAQIRLRSNGRVELVDAAKRRLAVSRPAWVIGERMRLDWQQTWDGAHDEMSVTVWVYVDNPEGWRPDVVLSTTFASPSAVHVALAAPTTTSSIGFDTYREYDDAGIPAPYNPTIGGAAVHSFDEGKDGKAVVPDVPPGVDGITGVAGHPTYSSTAAKHGALGVLVAVRTGGGMVRYDNPYPPAHTGSLYVRTTRRGASDTQIVTFQRGPMVLAQLMISTAGAIRIADAAGTLLAETSGQAQLNRWSRIDWQATWDGSDLEVEVRYFLVAESTYTFTTAEAGVPVSDIPDTIGVGTSSGGWAIHIDTFRTTGDVTAWPAPMEPGPTPQLILTGGLL